MRKSNKQIRFDANKVNENNVEQADNTKNKDSLNFLKRAKIPEQLDSVKEQLISTFEARRSIIEKRNSEIDLYKEFPYFFAAPELVSKIISN